MITENLNFLTESKFKVVLTSKTKNVEFAIKTFDIPSIKVTNIKQMHRNKPVYFAGDTFDYGDQISLNFIITENMENYNEIYSWVLEIFANKIENSDMTLFVLDSHFSTIGKFVFYNIIPIGTPALKFSSENSDYTYLTGDIEIQYDRYEFIKS